jgi:hypothetical protein
MTKLKTKIISSLTIAVMLSSSGSLAFADDNINTIKDTSGTGSISEIINKYEDYLKNTKDNKRFDKLLKEKSLIQTRNISDDLKNEIINNTIYKAKKQRLDGDSELSKIKDKKVKDRAL